MKPIILFFGVILSFCTMGLVGCGSKTPEYVYLGRDDADKSLTNAAAMIQRDMRIMTDEYEGSKPGVVHTLSTKISYRFTGEAKDMLADIAKKIQYKLKTTGKEGNQALVVKIYTAEPQSYFDILQSAGTQLDNRADIQVDDRTQTITLAYGGLKKNIVPTIKKSTPLKKVGSVKSAPKKVVQKNNVKQLLIHKGDIKEAHQKIASGLGYVAKVEGTPTAIPVNLASGTRSWPEIVDIINKHMKTANLFINHADKTVVLKYWR